MGAVASMNDEAVLEFAQVKEKMSGNEQWTAEIEASLAEKSPLTLGDVKVSLPGVFEAMAALEAPAAETPAAEAPSAEAPAAEAPAAEAPAAEAPAAEAPAAGPTEEEIKGYRTTFDAFDTSGDGTISSKELFNAMKEVGMNPTQAEIDEMISNVDEDGSRAVDFKEFIDMMKRLTAAGSAETEAAVTTSADDADSELLQQFMAFDADSSGSVTFNELKAVMKEINPSITEDQLKAMMKYGDKDHDGKIDYNEFVKLYNEL